MWLLFVKICTFSCSLDGWLPVLTGQSCISASFNPARYLPATAGTQCYSLSLRLFIPLRQLAARHSVLSLLIGEMPGSSRHSHCKVYAACMKGSCNVVMVEMCNLLESDRFQGWRTFTCLVWDLRSMFRTFI